MIAKLIAQLAGQALSIFGEWGKGKQDWIQERANALQRSGTDEFIAVVWFSPLVVAWFSPERAQAWIESVLGSNDEYTGIVIGITMAVFGLGKLNGRKV